MKNTILKYGVIGGITISILSTGMLMINKGEHNFENGQLIGYATMIIALSTVFLGIKSYRDNEQAGLITFGKAFKIGILITLIASMFYIIAWMLYFQFGDGQEMMSKYIEYSVEKMQAGGSVAEEISTKRTELEAFTEQYNNNALIRIGFTFIEIFPVGLIITLISAFILKRGVK